MIGNSEPSERRGPDCRVDAAAPAASDCGSRAGRASRRRTSASRLTIVGRLRTAAVHLVAGIRARRSTKLRSGPSLTDGDLARLQERITSGIDLDAQDSRRGYVLLHVAAQQLDVEAVRLLLRSGANPNVADAYRNGPLWTAVFNDREGQFSICCSKPGRTRRTSTTAGTLQFLCRARSAAWRQIASRAQTTRPP